MEDKKKKGKKVKCPYCNKMNYKEDTIRYKNRYYCKKCYEEDKKKTKKNTDGWDELYEFVKQLYGEITTRMIVQLAKYRKDYNFKNAGMQMTLYYYHYTLGNSTDSDAIGLIPYYYERAEREYLENVEIHNHNKEFVLKPLVKKVKVSPESRFDSGIYSIINKESEGIE